MEVLTINGKQFVKAVNVAHEFGYAPDYVGQLARSGAVSAERVGRAWYVSRDEVAAHKGEKRRSVAARARAGIAERVRTSSGEDSAVRVSGISYHDDDAPLMPQIARHEPRPSRVMVEPAEEQVAHEVDDKIIADTAFESVKEDAPSESQEESYRVHVRQVEKIAPLVVEPKVKEAPYGGYEISHKKEISEQTFSISSLPHVEVKYRSNVPYILVLGLSVVVLFVGMYTYVDGVATNLRQEKSYGVDVDVVNALINE
ncbi:hypothetical protein A3C89_00370 [Candidatus Kaiserbacteria bacterium RIFCSPHIGHO2_02_FULL_50_50]|uniref:Helix-turn-helix domain-containing protein n=1 Tax=Candidatus Kaiserbacteria bacterium RIFCSPHIGHO2_02_FULL_50_50 TaxID=1798492 RepID=A0A1F6DE53_9BACT|nr:MAG: hypothetical protein A3C89_00370 [Candidatus Kaiserbacteria bacterium RIFCSPHIGHO2_02_FULL_50_50]OGG89198.1 MAG: hypothetical protein A3G62_01050 [Candidatus Kaiserbacteria bacterium RIFCSPLOWO2_12_FULL_50_10]